ncbi:hypothetical protein TI39_contig683g00004 [Zymoseptoria brevis]|uniref:Uncharacterized protein n=1 Tax=Zymoseptoria brevis TaxID=1047168 RepID=A0A0F4GFT2_9PEZI|nr:hypothetical protein TI39_contig683g00004 [Zymoseptoria brevis]
MARDESDTRMQSPSPSPLGSSSSGSDSSSPTPEPEPAEDYKITPASTATPARVLPKPRRKSLARTKGTFEHCRSSERQSLLNKLRAFIEKDAGACDIPRIDRMPHLLKLRDQILAANEASGKGSLRTKFPDKWSQIDEDSHIGQWAWRTKTAWLSMVDKVPRHDSVKYSTRSGTTAVDEDDEEPDVKPVIKREVVEEAASVTSEGSRPRNLRTTPFLSDVMLPFVADESEGQIEAQNRAGTAGTEVKDKPMWVFIGGKLGVRQPIQGPPKTEPQRSGSVPKIKREYEDDLDTGSAEEKPRV